MMRGKVQQRLHDDACTLAAALYADPGTWCCVKAANAAVALAWTSTGNSSKANSSRRMVLHQCLACPIQVDYLLNSSYSNSSSSSSNRSISHGR
jgi:hypothetical protein